MRVERTSSAKLGKWLFLLVLFAVLVFAFRLLFIADSALPAEEIRHWLFPLEMSLLLGALVTLCFAQIMRDRDEPDVERPVWFYPLMAGLLGLCGMVAAYTHLGIWPTGPETGMIVDMHHQYAPLLSQLRHMLITGGSPLYSFEVGLGTNFLPLFGYYLASPLNLLLVFFPESLLPEAILVITLIKNALCAAFFAAMVQYLFGKRDFRVCIVSIMYSLMMYLLAYSWNIMWLDCVMILPLILIGFERLMRTGRFTMYVLTLAYALFVNYYIGFMVCVFLVLYYLVYVLRQPHSLGQFGRSVFRFGVGSLLGGGLAMCLLLPVYLSLSTTSAAGGSLPSEFSANFPALGVFEQLLYGVAPTIRSGNQPNLYCGILAIVLLPIYFTISSIPLRRRLAMGGLLAAMAFSTTINIPDLIWHGLHSPNDLPYRFSFLVCLVLLLIAYETITHLSDVKPKQIGLSAVAIGAGIVILEKLKKVEVLTGAEKVKELSFASVYVSLLFVAVYVGILLLTRHKEATKRIGSALLLTAVTIEMTLGACVTLDRLNSQEYFTDHENYVDNLTTEAIRLAVAETQLIAKQKNPDGFYRMEFLPRRTSVDTALFHYQGLTTFASSNPHETTRLMGSLGYAINGVNSYLYRSFVASTDSLLGIRYVILESNISNHDQLKQIDSVTASRVNADGVTESKTLYIYENTTALPPAYFVNSDIHSFAYNYYKPFHSQNDLYDCINGTADSVYTFSQIEAEDGNSTTSGLTAFTVNGANTATFFATVEERGQYFLFADCRAASSISITSGSNTWNVQPYEPYIIDAGTLNPGDEVTFSVTTTYTASGNLFLAKLNEDVFERTNAALAENGLKVTEFTNTSLKGTLTAPSNGAVMTSLVYDKGFTVMVDGKAVETFAVGEGFLGFDVSAGAHTIEITFFPQGLSIGLLISGISLLLLIALYLLRFYAGRDRVKVSQAGDVVAENPILEEAIWGDSSLEETVLGEPAKEASIFEETISEKVPTGVLAPIPSLENVSFEDLIAEDPSEKQ